MNVTHGVQQIIPKSSLILPPAHLQDSRNQFIDLTAEETVAVLDELAVRTGVPRDKVEQVAFRAFSIAGRTYRLVRHNLAEIQDIREEASLIFRMEDGEGIGLLDQAA